MSGKAKKPKPTQQERALAERGANEYNRYVTEYSPLVGKIKDDIRVTDGERSAVRGAANADVTMASRDSGTGPVQGGSGRSVFSLAGRSVAAGTAGGAARGEAVQAAENNELAGLQKLARFGRGLADNSTLGLSNAAQQATSVSIAKARASNQAKDDLMTAVGTGVGMYTTVKGAKVAGEKPRE